MRYALTSGRRAPHWRPAAATSLALTRTGRPLRIRLGRMPVLRLFALEGQDRLLHAQELFTLGLDCFLDGERTFGELRQVLHRLPGA